MKLYYYIDRHGNFGDDLNPWLWQKLIPNMLNDDDSELFIGIGTLLNNNIPEKPKKYVFGSGVGYGSSLPKIDDKWTFYCVRGPISAEKLGLSRKYAITDAAALVSTVFRTTEQQRTGLAFIPHHVSAWNLDWERICREVGIRYIDPRQEVEIVLTAIANSSAVLTEAMHGAILADTFRVPWMPVVMYDHILHSKWMDWAQSLSLEYSPVHLNGAWDPDYTFSAFDRLKMSTKRMLSRAGINSTNWTQPPQKSTRREMDTFIEGFRHLATSPSLTLSRDSVFSEAQGRLLEALEKFKTENS